MFPPEALLSFPLVSGVSFSCLPRWYKTGKAAGIRQQYTLVRTQSNKWRAQGILSHEDARKFLQRCISQRIISVTVLRFHGCSLAWDGGVGRAASPTYLTCSASKASLGVSRQHLFRKGMTTSALKHVAVKWRFPNYHRDMEGGAIRLQVNHEEFFFLVLFRKNTISY